MMTSHAADRLVGLCRKGEFRTAQTELFAQDALICVYQVEQGKVVCEPLFYVAS